MQDHLAGTVMAEDGTPVPGPNVARLEWSTSWPPPGPTLGDIVEPAADRPSAAGIEYPDDESMRVSHEAIYQALYIQGRGALRRELTACLRTGRALRCA